MRAKLAIRLAIRGETKARTRNATKAVKKAWKHDSTYRRLVKARKQAHKALQGAHDKLEKMRREEAKLLAKIQSEITLPNVCTDLILCPKWVSPISPLYLDLVFARSITQSKTAISLPPPTLLDVTLPQDVLSIPAPLSIYQAPAPQHKRAKLILPPPTKFPPSSHPPLDITTPESTTNETTLDLHTESICTEFGIQTKIPTGSKLNTKKPNKSLRSAWKNDRCSVKAETQPDMAFQSDNERLEEMYREEAILWPQKDPEFALPHHLYRSGSPPKVGFAYLPTHSRFWVGFFDHKVQDKRLSTATNHFECHPSSYLINPAPLSIHPAPAPQPKCPKLILPPPTITSSPLDSTTAETTPSTMTPDPRIEAIRAKISIQAKIQTESKARLKKSTKAVRNAWKRDRRAVKARKQADKALQNATDKIAELRREVVRALSEKGQETKVLSG